MATTKAKKKPSKPPKPTGVNKGIKKGVDAAEFESHVICKKCGKDVKFTLGSQLFLKCPRCGAKVERNPKQEDKEAQKIIKYDILRRAKKWALQIGFFLTCVALAYNIIGFFCELFVGNQWWFALFSIPVILLSFVFTRITRLKSASKKYKFFAWLAFILNFVAIAVMVVSAVPAFSDKLLALV